MQIETRNTSETLFACGTVLHPRRILSRLARLMRGETLSCDLPATRTAPVLPPPPAGDPVARFLLATYGMPSTGGAK